MTIWQRIARNPVAIVGLGTALYGVLVAFGVLELTVEQTGALTTLAGAVFFALRWLVTPSGEVVLQKPAGERVRAGAAVESVAAVPVDGVPIQPGDPVSARITRILGKA